MSASATDLFGRSRMRARRPGPLVAPILALLTLVGCSAPPPPPAAGPDPIRIGVVTICEGTFAQNRDLQPRGCRTPVHRARRASDRQGRPSGRRHEHPGGWPTGGAHVCVRTWWGSLDHDLGLQQLVERSGADIVIGPALAARRHRGARVCARPSRRHVHRHRHRAIVDAHAIGSQPLPVRSPTSTNGTPARHLRAAYARMEQRRHLRRCRRTRVTKLGFHRDVLLARRAGRQADRLFTDQSPHRSIPDRLGVQDPGDGRRTFPDRDDRLVAPSAGPGRWYLAGEQTHAPLKRHLLVGWGLLYPSRIAGCVASWERARIRSEATPAWRQYNTALAQAFPG